MTSPDRGPLLTSLGLLAIGVVAVVGWLWPVLGQLDRVALGSPSVDLPAMLWTLWWGTQPDPAALVNQPFHGATLSILTPLNLAVARLLAPHTVLAHNLSCALAVLAAALGGGLWGARRGGRVGAWIGALGLAFAPPLGSALRDGTGEFTWIGLLALSLWACERLVDPASKARLAARTLLAAAVLAGCALSCWYYGLAAGLGAGLVALLRPQRRLAVPRVLVAGGLGILLVLPTLRSFSDSELEPQGQLGPSLVEHIRHGATGPEPDHSVVATPLLPRTQLVGSGDTAQPGWLLGLALLAGAALFARSEDGRALALAGAVAAVLALGSQTPGGLPLPMLWPNRLLLFYGRPLHLPFHLGALAVCALVGLAASGAARQRGLAWVGAGAVLGSLILPGSPLPMPALSVTAEPALAQLSTAAPHDGAVLLLPSALSDSQAALDDDALAQLQHHHPIARLPVFPTNLVHPEGVAAVRESALGRALLASPLASQRGSKSPSHGALARAEGDPDLQDLRQLGYRWIVLDTKLSPRLRPLLDRWLGPAWTESGDMVVYKLVVYPLVGAP